MRVFTYRMQGMGVRIKNRELEIENYELRL